jgi:hypothetical protein
LHRLRAALALVRAVDDEYTAASERRPLAAGRDVSVLQWLVGDVIEDEHWHRPLLQLELQSELPVERLG